MSERNISGSEVFSGVVKSVFCEVVWQVLAEPIKKKVSLTAMQL